MKSILCFLCCAINSGLFGTVPEILPSVNGLRVTICIFSGRPNPHYNITDPKLIDEIINFPDNLVKNTSFNGKTVIPTKFEYQGIIIENLSTSATNIRYLRLYHSDVEIVVNNKNSLDYQTSFRSDLTWSFENKLIKLAEESGMIHKDLMEHIKIVSKTK